MSRAHDPLRIGLLGRGTVGGAFAELLAERAAAVEAATGRSVELAGTLTRSEGDFAEILSRSDLIVELIGGTDPARDYVLETLRSGRPVVTANKQLLAQHGGELFGAARDAGVQLRFEAAVAGVIPIVRAIQESFGVTEISKVFGIVNGTTNFILSEMAASGTGYDEALARAQELGYAEADPTDDVSGADAAAKMAILASVAFGSRVALDEVETRGIEDIEPQHVAAAAELGMVVRLLGIATLDNEAVDVRVQPALVDRSHPLAAVDGAFNAVVLQGDAIREITLEGPGAGGLETASAVVADLVSVVGTAGTGFLQNDACWRELPRLDPGEWRAPSYLHLEVADRPGVLAHVTSRLAGHEVSVAQLVQHLGDGEATLDLVLHRAPAGAVAKAAAEIATFPEVLRAPFLVPVVSERPL
jgi:homoserine dehydrogenase